MALTKSTVAVNNISSLSATPNATEGLTAAQLQAKFDKSASDNKTYINDTLTTEIDSAINTIEDGLFNQDARIELQKNVIGVRYSAGSNFGITSATTSMQYPFNQTNIAVGDKLTLTNEKIVIGEGVSIIEASFHAVCIFKTATSILVYLKINGDVVSYAQVSSSSTTTNQNVVTSTNGTGFFEVSEGDVVSLDFYSASGTNNEIQRDGATELYVKVVG